MRLFGTKEKAVRRGEELPVPHQPSFSPTSHDGAEAAEPLGTSSSSFDSLSHPLTAPEDRGIAHRLLFVGGDIGWFRGLERGLLQLHPDWICTYVTSCERGLETLPFDTFDVLVLEARVAQGQAFLGNFLRQFPQAICLVRCNVWDRSTVEEWSALGATPIEEAGDAAALANSLEKAARLRVWLAEPAIQKVLPQLRTFPTMPELYADVMEQLSCSDISLENVARLISQDPVMTAKVLQVVNSTLFSLAYQVTDPAEAVLFLGTERTRSLILLSGVFSQFDTARRRNFAPDKIWVHSLQVGWFARRVALEETRNTRTAEAAFTAGLLHDIGKLVLAGSLPDVYEQIRQIQACKGCPSHEAELEVLGTTHAEIGATLLGSWGLALPVLEAIAFHHRPARSGDTDFSLLTAVHVANVFAHEAGYGSSSVRVTDGLSTVYLGQLGLVDAASRWRDLCGVPA